MSNSTGYYGQSLSNFIQKFFARFYLFWQRFVLLTSRQFRERLDKLEQERPNRQFASNDVNYSWWQIIQVSWDPSKLLSTNKPIGDYWDWYYDGVETTDKDHDRKMFIRKMLVDEVIKDQPKQVQETNFASPSSSKLRKCFYSIAADEE